MSSYKNLNLSRIKNSTAILIAILLGIGLYLTSRYNYLLFHTLAELFSIIIAGTVFALAWNARRYITNGYLLVIGISLLFVGVLDTLHTLSYTGMGVLEGYDSNLPTQLWIAGRYMQSLSFLAAIFFLRRSVRATALVGVYTILTTLLLLSIFQWNIFPIAHVEGVGLTPFKIYSELIITAILGAAIFFLFKNRHFFEQDVLNFLTAALVLSIVSEITFTFYVSVYSLSTIIGHYFKIGAFYYIYKAIVETGFTRPYNLLLRDYKEREETLIQNISLQKRLEQKAQLAANEAEQRASELEAVIQSMVEAVIVYDEHGKPVRSNPAARKMYGFDPITSNRKQIIEQLKLRTVDNELHTPESLPSGRALQGEQVEREIMKFNNLNGQELEVLVSGSPIYLQGQLRGAVAVWNDITEKARADRRQAELLTENRRQREMLARLVNEAPVGIVFLQGADHHYTLVNAAFLRITGLGHDPTGSTVAETFPENADTILAVLEEVYRTGSPVHRVNEPNFVSNAETSRYFTYTFTPLFAHQRKVEGVLFMIEDTTDEVRAQLALDSERARLKTIIENSPVGILVADGLKNVILANPAARQLMPNLIPGSQVYENENYHILDKLGQSVADDDRPMARAMRDKEAHTNIELILEREGEPSRSLLVNTAPILGDNGQVIGAVSLFQDITERKQVEAELERYAARLERSNAELQQFAFVVSHDLQEPLRKVRAFGERLQHHAGSRLEEQELDFLNRMTNAAQRMQTMIDDLLAYSRITTKARPFEQVDLKRITYEVLSDLEVRIERSRGQVEVNDLPVIEADPMQIRQLLQNLIGNALKYHRPDVPPLVEISAEVKNNELTLFVKDNGIGFEPSQSERIFNPFERLHGRSAYEGTGMGLPICRKIVERHLGHIYAQSQPGVGSTFITTLPVRQTEPVNEITQSKVSSP